MEYKCIFRDILPHGTGDLKYYYYVLIIIIITIKIIIIIKHYIKLNN